MGIIRATIAAVSGALADQWEEVLEADNMSDETVFTRAVAVRQDDRRNRNRRGSADVISNGSIIHVYPNQFMLLVEGGRVIDFTAEEGYYKVDNSAAPSLFAGQFGDALADAFRRIKFGGVPSYAQKAYFINLQEIKGIKFGTRTPVNYFDSFYNAELFLRAFGSYSIKITDPLKFYAEAIPRNVDRVDIGDINEQYLSEFLEALTAAINRMSADGIRISHVVGQTPKLSQYMATELDESWKSMRGFEIQAVGIASLSYDDESKKLINMRNQGAMLGDPSVREGYMQGAVARGIEAAGSNSAGAAQAFMGMGLANTVGASAIGAAAASSAAQRAAAPAPAPAEEGGWTCACGARNKGKFCAECGKPRPADESGWICSCGAHNKGKFCSECGSPRPDGEWVCSCGARNKGKFCAECGKPRA